MTENGRPTSGTALLSSDARRLASAFPPLLLEAERVANIVRQGVHGRRRAGQGETFWQFRRYAAGEPAARIDWRQSARGDRLFVREREWEAAQSVYLWADASASMRWRSHGDVPEKIVRARVLMLALADLLLRGGEKPVWLDGEPVAIPSRAALERIAAHIDPAPDSASLPPDLPFARHAHMILASDFLMPPDALRDLMQRMAALNLKGALLHILDPAEEALPFEGRIEMKGCEGEAPLLVPNAGALHDAYRAALAEHQARLQRYAESAGWFYIAHVTARPATEALMQVFESLAAG